MLKGSIASLAFSSQILLPVSRFIWSAHWLQFYETKKILISAFIIWNCKTSSLLLNVKWCAQTKNQQMLVQDWCFRIDSCFVDSLAIEDKHQEWNFRHKKWIQTKMHWMEMYQPNNNRQIEWLQWKICSLNKHRWSSILLEYLRNT